MFKKSLHFFFAINCFLLFGFFFSHHSLFCQDANLYVPQPIQLKPFSSEFGFMLGVSYYTGDLNPAGHFNRFTRPAGGLIYRYNFHPRISAKAFAGAGLVEGDDAFSKIESHRNRNLSFRSKIFEFSLHAEFNFLPFVMGSKKHAATSPYVFAGMGVFHFNPMAYYQNRWYFLQPFGTEGQGTTFAGGKRYSLTQFSIPFGAGMKINIAKRSTLALEWGLRKTFTDYLDDVSGRYVNPFLLEAERGPIAAALSDRSLVKEGGNNTGRQRGNAYTNDWYSFAGIVFTFKLKGEYECDAPH